MGLLDNLISKIDKALGKDGVGPAVCPPRPANCPKCGTSLDTAKLPREARKWLKGNPAEYAFAPNAFGKTENALKYVHGLYRAGAKAVNVGEVLAEDWRLAETGGPLSDTLFVTVSRPGAKKKVDAYVKKHSDNYEPDEKSWKGNTLRLWWD